MVRLRCSFCRNAGGGHLRTKVERYPARGAVSKFPHREEKALLCHDERPLGELLHEIYEAVQGKQHRLALMGIRAFFEQLMIAKVGDQGTFGANLNKFLEEGFIAKIQLTAIKHILESGHAAIHRGYKPVEHDLNTALDILEAITETIFFHEREAKQVAARVPPRGSSAKAEPQGNQFIPPSNWQDD
jgi:Domain of unknown function (DUF4145)